MKSAFGLAIVLAGLLLPAGTPAAAGSDLHGAHATTLVVADLDRDGAMDLVVGYATPAGGAVAIHRGNLAAIFPRSPLPEVREARRAGGDAPFLPDTEVHAFPAPAQMLAAGDVDGDGHPDVTVGSCGEDGLWLLPGREGGAPGKPRRIALPGALLALVAGDLDRPDGATGLAVAVEHGEGSRLLLYASPRGALLEAPEEFPVQGRVTRLLVERVDRDGAADVVAAAGGVAWMVPGIPGSRSVLRLEDRVVAERDDTVAVAAARLNEDGVDDLVIVREGEVHPEVVLSTSFATLTVTSTGDQPDAVPGNGVCATAGGVCTLRAAIQEANALAGSDTIQFALGAGTPTISPLSPLPTITGTVAILGDTGGATRIQIEGTSAGVASGLVLSASTSILRALVVNRFSLNGIQVNGASNRIENCWIGLDAAGGASVPGNAGGGIDLNALVSQSSNTIGGALPARNVISHNGSSNVRVTRHGNAVMGNFIGTDATGMLDVSTGVGVFLTQGAGTNGIGGSTVAPGRPPGNLISGNLEGLRFTTMSDSLVQGNLIGTDRTGLVGLGNGTGIVVEQSSQGNLIGGATADFRNVVSGNVSTGVVFFGPGNFGNAVEGNWIGVDDTGTVALGNGSGVDVNDVPRTRIGGPSLAPGVPPGNVIAGNLGDGVVLRGPGASTNIVQRNLVGTSADGTAALGNGGDGIEIFDRASSSTIDGNVASGNAFAGVRVHGASANAITGNLLGTGASGLSAIPNGASGVVIHDGPAPAQFNLVGGGAPSLRNVISANGEDGVAVFGTTTTSNGILGNFIGTDAGGLLPLGNAGAGVRVDGGASGNRIGGISGAAPGTCSGECNVIAFNGLAGVSVEGAGSASNPVRNASIHDNVFLGIDLGAFGVTQNDALDADAGANGLQNFPGIEGAAFDGTNTSVTLGLRSAPSTAYEIDLYGNDGPDPTGHGEALTYLGSTSCITNGAGDCPLLAAVVPGEPVWIAATATSVPTQDTSELSAAFTNPAEASPLQDLTASRGAGSSVDVVYQPACGASGHAIYWGQTPISGSLSWIASACGLGVTGLASFDPGTPAPGRAIYFVAVGQNTTREGSYGNASSGGNRPEAVMIGACDRPLALTNTCP